MIFKGVGTALVTPFNKDFSIDYKAYERLLDYQLNEGVDALIACGTTAEVATLSEEEKLKLIDITIKKAKDELPIIVGTGSNNTLKAIEFSKKVSEIDGVSALLVVTPYYNKTSQEGLYEHFKLIAESVDKPIILYNVPSRTGVSISPEIVLKLSSIENIVGIKDATGDLHYASKIKSLVNNEFAIYSGNDDLIGPILSIGGDGVISVLSNILPRETREMVEAYYKSDNEKLAKDHIKYLNIIEYLFSEVSPIPVKEALKLMGICEDYVRLPLVPASDATSKLLESELRKLGKIWQR